MNKTKLKIYADQQMSVEIATWLIDEDSSHNLYFDTQENDLLDGQDWWEGCVKEIEEKYGNSWNCFEIISPNEDSGRILERDYCVNYQKSINYFSWVSKLYLFGDTTWGQLEKTFDGCFTYQVEHRKIRSNKYYRLGTDENIISMIKSVAGNELKICPVLDVVLNPSPTSLVALKLADPYKFPIYIPTKSKVQRLGKLHKALEISIALVGSSSTFLRAIDQLELTDLNFISKSMNSLDLLIDRRSTDSLYSKFMDEFKY